MRFTDVAHQYGVRPGMSREPVHRALELRFERTVRRDDETVDVTERRRDLLPDAVADGIDVGLTGHVRERHDGDALSAHARARRTGE